MVYLKLTGPESSNYLLRRRTLVYSSKNVLFSQKDFLQKGHSLCFLPTPLISNSVHSKLSAIFFLLFSIFLFPPFWLDGINRNTKIQKLHSLYFIKETKIQRKCSHFWTKKLHLSNKNKINLASNGKKVIFHSANHFILELEQFHSSAPLCIAYANARTTFNFRAFQE